MTNDVKIFDVKTCVGKSESDALESISESKMVYHVVRRDDEHFVRTMDYRVDRVNLEIDNNVVVLAALG